MSTVEEFVSPQSYCYGYRVNEPAAVDYLLTRHPEWIRTYHLLKTHWAAMTVVARDLSDLCGLTVYADRIWVGSGCFGLGMVFTGVSMGDHVRTPEDSAKLRILEHHLVDLKLVATPEPELEILYSSTYPPNLEEPLSMKVLPPPELFGGEEIMDLLKRRRELEWNNQRREKGDVKVCEIEGDLRELELDDRN